MNKSNKTYSAILQGYSRLLNSQNYGSKRWILSLASWIMHTHKELIKEEFTQEEYNTLKSVWIGAYYILRNRNKHGLFEFLLFKLEKNQNVRN